VSQRPDYVRLLSRGLAVAAVVGAYYVASRRPVATAPPRLIDWSRVRGIASTIARRAGDLGSYEHLRPAYAAMVERSQGIIVDYTGEALPRGTDNVYVFDRLQWLDANVENFQLLFEPIEEVNGDLLRSNTLGLRAFGDVNQLVLSGQMGILLGYLSRRVLGQYDLALLGREPVMTGRLYFVEPNIAHLERKLGLEARDFRLWIALHETTHAYEFEAHPWVREHMNGLLRRYFATLGEDLNNLRTDARGVLSFVRRVGQNVGKGGYAVELVMTPEQREIFRSLQALMCLLEGYSNHVMDHVGRTLLPSYERMKARFEDRQRRRGLPDRLFAKLTGLDVKFEQYQLGERFVNDVVARVGVQGMNRVWRGPEALPTLDEVRAPERWIERSA
jgi:coenzyme F420 biosynthesis associated uncharacterized protein